MTLQLVCRVCLAKDVRMHLILNTDLQDVYENLCGNTLQSEGKSVLACYICYSHLRRCSQLTKRALKAEELLNQILRSGDGISNDTLLDREANELTTNLSISPIEHSVQIAEARCESSITVKDETIICKLECQQTEVKPDPNEPCSEVEDTTCNDVSDSEDDIPLKSISVKKELERSGSTKVKSRKKPVKDLKINAQEIILTEEQQMSDLMKRAESLNYLNSPYKCDVCYKGFVDAKAYHNHKEKHDERSGAFACGVCGLRYRALRLLRSHSASAHARLYQCRRCPHRAHTANQAREHEKWHNGHVYECQLCSQQFKKPTSYFTHMRKRHPTEHVCDVCGASFVGRHGLGMHKSKAHRWDRPEESPSEPAADRFCAECDIQFLTLAAWQRHILSSIRHTLTTGDGSVCGICNVRISGESVAAHMKDHERALREPRAAPPPGGPLAQLACDQCGANFANRSKLLAHVRRVHLGYKYNKNIVCEVCGKHCTSNATLKYHQRTHTGERPFGCGSCGKRFASSNLLRIHARTHSGERPYCCGSCGKRFSQKPALNRHYRVHTGAKPYVCQYCSKTFSQSNSVKLHIRSVHLKLPTNNRMNKVQKSTDDVVLQVKSQPEKVMIQNV